MPVGGGQARADQIATLQGLAHDRLVSPDIERLLANGSIRRPVKAVTPRGMHGTNPLACSAKHGVILVARKNCPRISSNAQPRILISAASLGGCKRKSDFRNSCLISARSSGSSEKKRNISVIKTPHTTPCSTPTSRAQRSRMAPFFAVFKARLVPLLKKVMSSVSIDDSILYIPTTAIGKWSSGEWC